MPERDLRDWRTPVLPHFEPSGGLAFDTGDDVPRETYAMCFNADDPALRLLYDGEVCPNCASRFPATPCRENLHLFDVHDYTPLYPEAMVRELITNEQCPICRCLVRRGEVARNIQTEDRWSPGAVERDKQRMLAAKREDEHERARHAAKKAGA